MIRRALNQKTAPHLDFERFLDLAQSIGCTGVEARNDLGRPFFGGIAPGEAERKVRARGLRLLGLSEVYGFNVWNDERAAQVAALIETAEAAGAETISLIPSVDDRPVQPLVDVMREILPLVRGRNVLPLIEPIGFATSSLKAKRNLVAAIDAVGGPDAIKLVHDTFQHCIAGEHEIFAPYTAIVHISGISNRAAPLDASQDAHRILVDANDRCGNVEQIAAFLEAGYQGAFSFECTSAAVQNSATLERDLRVSFDDLDGRLVT